MNALVLRVRDGISSIPREWQIALASFLLATTAVIAAYWPTAKSLFWVWAHDGTYQYAFLIFPITIWTALQLRHKCLKFQPKPTLWALPIIAILVLIWLVGRFFSINLPQHFAFVAMFPALTLAMFGWRIAWTLKFPLAYLAFAIPWGDSMVGSLQDLTAHMAVRALSLTGTPVILNGREIITPTAVWMVANACSGVKFFIACTSLSCLFSFLMYRRWWKRIFFVFLGATVPMVANGLRVFFTILIGDGLGLKYATGTDHMIFGWQFFGSVLILLLVVGWFFRDDDGRLKERGVPRPKSWADNRKPRLFALVSWGLAVMAVLSGAVAGTVLAPRNNAFTKIKIPAPAIAGWRGPFAKSLKSSGWKPHFAGAAGEFLASYRNVEFAQSVDFYHALYLGIPRRGHDLVTYGNNPYGHIGVIKKVRILSSDQRHVRLASGRTLTVRELRIARPGQHRLVWYWYCIDQQCTDSGVYAKLLQIGDALRGRRLRSSVWAVAAQEVRQNESGARKALRAFVKEFSFPKANKIITEATVTSQP